MSEVPTQSESRSTLAAFIDLRDSLRANRIGDGGRELCAGLTRSLDEAVANLIDTDHDDPVAVVALGGYGRGELSPHSDVDLMLLHDLEDPSELASRLFRPLWDAKLKVGHSVRTVKEAGSAARERFDTQTTLLTARLVAGSQDLFDALAEQVAAVTRARPMRRHLVAGERIRREETPFLVMATDVKSGRGGLRTLQGFDWERRREDLIGRFSSGPGPVETGARESLLRIRNGLHVVTGRAHEVFSPELRDPVANWLGSGVFDVAAELVEAMQSVDGLAERRWPEVVEETAPLARRVWGRISGRGVPASGASAPTFDQFVHLLESGERGRVTFERLWDEGLLADVIPEWEVVRSLPQLEAFHEHPVAPHLWRTTHEMTRLIAGDDHFARVAQELDRPHLLVLAAFLHDIGKGHGGDHATVGAAIARSFGARMSLSTEATDLIVRAVQLHLLLPIEATRRDLDDPAVIDDIAGEVGSLDLLQILYLLTVADSRATGPSMWTEWKATLLQTLFVRCAARFGGEEASEAGSTRTQVLDAAGPERAGEAGAHLEAMPEEYQRSHSAADSMWHLDLISELNGLSNLGVHPSGLYDTVVVVGPSRSGRRHVVASALAANGIDVLEARMHTRDDGMTVDSFQVRDDRTKTRVPAERWARLAADIEAGLAGDLDTASKVASRAAAYPDASSTADKPTARAGIDSASGDLVVTVKCSDRIGRLAEILAVFNDCGLEIRLAKLDSREGELIDTFHVDPHGAPADLLSLEQRIAAAIVP